MLRDDEPGVEAQARAGGVLEVEGAPWRVPATARTVTIVDEPIGWVRGGVLATPGAVPRSLGRDAARSTFFSLDNRPDAIEHVRNAVAAVDPLAGVATLDGYLENPGFAFVRRALYAAATIVLVVIVLVQTAIPVTLGVLLAIAAGVGIGAILLEIVSEPFSLDVGAIAAMAGAGAGVVLLVTLLTLPALWRLMRPDGLRTE